MPQMEFADYMPQVVWLVITFATLYVLMAKLALPRITDILETRQRHLEHDLELSEKLRDEAQATLAEYDAAIVSARAETESLLAKARESIQTETQERIAELNGRLESEIRESDAIFEDIPEVDPDEEMLDLALELIEREKVTRFVGVPTQSWDLLESPDFEQRDTSSLTNVGGGGAPAPPELVKRIEGVEATDSILIELKSIKGDTAIVHTHFMVARIMHTGETSLFATGRYLDDINVSGPDYKFRERIVVIDSDQIDTLLAIPL